MEKKNTLKRIRVVLKWFVKLSTIIVELADYFKKVYNKQNDK